MGSEQRLTLPENIVCAEVKKIFGFRFFPDHSIDTGLLATYQVAGPAFCAFQCTAHDKCLSYNYEHESSGELHNCELLDRTKNEAMLNSRVGYTHYETGQVCINTMDYNT